MASIYLLGDGADALAQADKIIHRSLDKFSEDQARSVMSLLNTIKDLDAANKTEKTRLRSKLKDRF